METGLCDRFCFFELKDGILARIAAEILFEKKIAT